MSEEILTARSVDPKQERSERAQRAVKVFRSMQPMLTGYARAITRRKDVTVELASGAPRTDGKKIFFRPPMELGDNHRHNRSLCDRRDAETLLQLCMACGVREEVLVNIIHEIDHIAHGTFEEPSPTALAGALDRAIDEAPGAYADRIRANWSRVPDYKRNSYLNLSSLISPFLPVIVNALEDARVDEAMHKARKGTRVMFEASLKRTFREGVEDDEGNFWQWRDKPLNSQALIGVYVLACGFAYQGWFSPEIEEALGDGQLRMLCSQVDTIRSAEGTYNLAFPVLARLRELGFCRSVEDPEVPEEQEPEESDEENNSDSSDSEESDGDESDDDSESDGDSGDESGADGDGTSDSDESDAGSEDGGEDTPDTGDSGGRETPSEDETSDDSGSEGEGTPDDPSMGEEEDSEPDAGDSPGESSPGEDADGSEDGDGDDPTEGDEESGGESAGGSADFGEPSSSDGQSGSEEDDSGDASGSGSDDDGSSASGEPSGGLLDQGLSDGDERDGEEPGEEPADRDGREPSDLGDDLIDTGADEGLGGERIDSNPLYGTAEEAAQDVMVFSKHDLIHNPEPPTTEEKAEEKALDMAILQGTYFESPSVNVEGVREHRYPDRESDEHADGWNNFGTDLYKRYADIFGADMTEEALKVGEEHLGPALIQMRRAFADNKRATFEKHRKSGKINPKVLGKRAPFGDERLFQKKRLPGKKDYAVLIGLDISGSTIGENIALIKRAAFAQAELCARMGIDFAVYAHSGNGGWTSEGLYLDIYEIKAFDKPWDTQAKDALSKLCADSQNLDGHTLEYYRRIIERHSATDKIIMYYTDGKMPAENHDEELEILKREILHCKMKQILLMGVGIRTDSPVRHGLETVQVDDDSDLVKVIRHLESGLLRHR